MTQTLLKALKITQNNKYKDVLPFIQQAYIQEDNIFIVVVTKAKKFNSETRQVEDIETDNCILNLLNEHPDFIEGDIQGDTYVAKFGYVDINLLKNIIPYYNETENSVTLPHSEEAIAEKQKLIDTITNQIRMSREQANTWEADLDKTHKKALKEMEEANNELLELIKEARKKGLI